MPRKSPTDSSFSMRDRATALNETGHKSIDGGSENLNADGSKNKLSKKSEASLKMPNKDREKNMKTLGVSKQNLS